MFKKLKAKIEEGGEGAIENVSFSERKLPGSVVRSQSAETSGEPLPLTDNSLSRSPSRGSHDEEQDVGVTVLPIVQHRINSVSEAFPVHITSKPPSTYEAILEARIKELENECSGLDGRLIQAEQDHQLTIDKLHSHSDKIDTDRTELKLQVVELQLERTELESRLHEGEKVWESREREIGAKREKERREFEEKIASLEDKVQEKDKELVDRGTVLSELETKTTHLQAQLEAFKEASESEVMIRLQSEVADLEKVVRSRNVDIQIMERRLAHQAKGSQEEYGVVVDRQFSLESSYKELSSQLDQRKQETKQLVKELEKETKQVSEREKEVNQLQTQLNLQEDKHRQLIEKLEDMRTNHERQIVQVDRLVQEKDERITELLCNLKQLRGGEDNSAHLPDGSVLASLGGLRPPGMARRTATIGVQTSEDISIKDPPSDPAVLPVDVSLGGTGGVVYPVLTNGDRATMMSLGPLDELAVLREEQLRLEEDVAEKNKIIKVQQQKILDMKKALTKELQRTQDVSIKKSNRVDRTPSPPPPRITADVNFKYLKYVILKFISSREEESAQLIRAISTLLEFTPQEEKYVRDYLNYKRSWFGSSPPPLTPTIVKK